MLRRKKKKVPPSTQGTGKIPPGSPDWFRYRRWLFVLLVVRWIAAFLITTEFVPDEAWQSTEVAYYYTFGRGHLTWEWLVGLRSHIYPFLISGIYYLLKWTGLDTPWTLLAAPRVFQATISAFGEYALFLYSVKRFGYESGKLTLFVTAFSWFSVYTSSRTLTNSVEMALNAFSMYLLQRDQAVLLSGVVALNFLIRPTALAIWIPQIFQVYATFFPIRPFRTPKAILVGGSLVVLGAGIDTFVYKRVTMSWLRFIKFNFLEGRSAEFGEHHVLWYFYSGVPSALGLFVIPLAYSLSQHAQEGDSPTGEGRYWREWVTILGYLSIFSLVKHKEIRFLLPVLPFMYVIIGDVIQRHIAPHWHSNKIFFRGVLRNLGLMAILSNIGAILYFCFFHQGSILPATEWVNAQIKTKGLTEPNVWVLTQCYAVPVFTYMHNPSARFEYITCGPSDLPIDLNTTLPNFRKYSEKLEDLSAFVADKIDNTTATSFPDFILCFDSISKLVVNIFSQYDRDYEVCFTKVHAQFGDDRGSFQVLCQK